MDQFYKAIRAKLLEIITKMLLEMNQIYTATRVQ